MRVTLIQEESETVETVKKDTPKFGRNEMVKITDGKNTKELKYKKAQPLLKMRDGR